jgi:hypothetical protein
MKHNMRWFIFFLGSLATFRLSHLIAKERGPLAVFERLGNGISLSASALVCLIPWFAGQHLSWGEWFLQWLGFSAVALIINQVFKFQKCSTANSVLRSSARTSKRDSDECEPLLRCEEIAFAVSFVPL